MVSMSCWMIRFTCCMFLYQAIFICDSSLFSNNISLTKILDQGTYRTLWNHPDTFCTTFSCLPYSSLCPLHWPSETPFQPASVTWVLGKSIGEYSVLHKHPAALVFLYPWCNSTTLDLDHHLPSSRLCCHSSQPSHHSSSGSFHC